MQHEKHIQDMIQETVKAIKRGEANYSYRTEQMLARVVFEAMRAEPGEEPEALALQNILSTMYSLIKQGRTIELSETLNKYFNNQ